MNHNIINVVKKLSLSVRDKAKKIFERDENSNVVIAISKKKQLIRRNVHFFSNLLINALAAYNTPSEKLEKTQPLEYQSTTFEAVKYQSESC